MGRSFSTLHYGGKHTAMSESLTLFRVSVHTHRDRFHDVLKENIIIKLERKM